MNEQPNTDELLRKIEQLSKENAWLRGILSAHGINYEQLPAQEVVPVNSLSHQEEKHAVLTREQILQQKKDLFRKQILQQRKDFFRSLFKGREDVFAIRWTSEDCTK